jgi:hypothetical protein
MNIDPHNPNGWSDDQPENLVSQGFGGVRFTAREEDQPKYDALELAGLQIMAIVTWESQGYVPYNADWIQVHNEMTSGDNPMSPEDYAKEYLIYRETYAHNGFRWSTGGLARGPLFDLAWMESVIALIPADLRPDAIAIHPYTLDPPDARDLFDVYWNRFQIPIIATEWWHPEYSHKIWDMQCMLNGDGGDGLGARSSLWNSWFCWTDAMVHPFGLFDDTGNPKPEYYSLLSSPCRA